VEGSCEHGNELSVPIKYWDVLEQLDRLCGLVVRVPGFRARGPSSIPGATRFTTEEPLGRKSSCSENREYGRRDP
jgi:hypothetical protein